MKSLYSLFISLLIPSSVCIASISFNGTSLLNTSGLTSGDVGVYVTYNSISWSSTFEFTVGESLFDSQSYGNGYTYLGTNTADSVFGSIILGGITEVNYSGLAQGNAFAVVVFENSTTHFLANDTYSVWTADNWDIPSDGFALTFGSDFTQLNSANSAFSTGNIVPEPSNYASIIGFVALSLALLRRRGMMVKNL